jgi:hypothetical protein
VITVHSNANEAMDSPVSEATSPQECKSDNFPARLETAFSNATPHELPHPANPPPQQEGQELDEDGHAALGKSPSLQELSESSNVVLLAYAQLADLADEQPTAPERMSDDGSRPRLPLHARKGPPSAVMLPDADQEFVDEPDVPVISPEDFGLLRMIGGRSMLGILVQQVLQRVKGAPQLNTYLLESVDTAVLVRKLTDLIIAALQPGAVVGQPATPQEVRAGLRHRVPPPNANAHQVHLAHARRIGCTHTRTQPCRT